jgi:hypothetical protein
MELKSNTVHLRIIGHKFCHSRNDSERESGLNCLKNHIRPRMLLSPIQAFGDGYGLKNQIPD